MGSALIFIFTFSRIIFKIFTQAIPNSCSWLSEYHYPSTSTLAMQGVLRGEERPCSLGAREPHGASAEA